VAQVSCSIQSPSGVLPARFRERVLARIFGRLGREWEEHELNLPLHEFHAMGICLLSVDVNVLRTSMPAIALLWRGSVGPHKCISGLAHPC